MNKVTLASTLNDPEGRLFEDIENHGEAIREMYNGRVGLAVTSQTSKKVVKALKLLTYKVFVNPKKTSRGNTYRQALRQSLYYEDVDYVHLIDFDRILHWTKNFPKEIKTVVKYPITNFLLFTRSFRAFETHPYTQRSTEAIVNRIASQKIGNIVDIMSGGFGMDKTTAKIILQQSKRKDSGLYAEIINIVLKNNIHIETYEVEGLEWETPDSYQKEIAKEGYNKWLAKWQSLNEWGQRIELVSNSLQELLK